MSADPHHRLRAALSAAPGDAEGRATRTAELLALYRSRSIVDADDQLAAAAILVAGATRAEIEAAQALALAASPAASPAARPLVARAFDRLRQLAGQPQKYGTLSDWPVDPHTTDAERAKWGVPPQSQLGRDHRQP